MTAYVEAFEAERRRDRRREAGADVVRRRGRKESEHLVPGRAKDGAAARMIAARRDSRARPVAATR